MNALRFITLLARTGPRRAAAAMILLAVVQGSAIAAPLAGSASVTADVAANITNHSDDRASSPERSPDHSPGRSPEWGADAPPVRSFAPTSLVASTGGPLVFFRVGTYEVRADDLWIIAIAIACGISCGVLGCFLVLRRLSLLGDAISHAILPGLAIAFLLTHSREPFAMLGGALVVGVLTALLSSGLARWGRVPEDAAMGVIFTSLFAVGVILITWVARDVDLDPGCVLYGLIEFTPFDTVDLFGVALPRAFVWLTTMLGLNVLFVGVFFKELQIVSFDPALATTMGISATLVHYALMTGVAATSVASFEAVGSILVIVMLVAPGATAHLLTDSLRWMLSIAAISATISTIVGYILAVWCNSSVAGMIATVALGQFILTAFLSPKYGIVSKQARRMVLSLRIAREDALGMLYRWHERNTEDHAGAARPLTAANIVAGARAGWLGHLAIWMLGRDDFVRRGRNGSLTPTPQGLDEARRVIRGHRLWETYLVKHLAADTAAVHTAAHRAEHFLSDSLQDRLEESAEGGRDPHGRAIPPKP